MKYKVYRTNKFDKQVALTPGRFLHPTGNKFGRVK